MASDALRGYRQIWQGKPVLRAIYDDFYDRILTAAAPDIGVIGGIVSMRVLCVAAAYPPNGKGGGPAAADPFGTTAASRKNPAPGLTGPAPVATSAIVGRRDPRSRPADLGATMCSFECDG